MRATKQLKIGTALMRVPGKGFCDPRTRYTAVIICARSPQRQSETATARLPLGRDRTCGEHEGDEAQAQAESDQCVHVPPAVPTRPCARTIISVRVCPESLVCVAGVFVVEAV